MPIDYGSEDSNWVKLPKVGEDPKEYRIKTAERVEDPEYKYNFTKKEEVELADGKIAKIDVNQGFRYVFTCEDDTKFSISSWKPYYAFKNANVQDGDHIRVSHPEEGVWNVEVLNRAVRDE